MALMAVGTLCFEVIPGPMLRAFSSDEQVIAIGTVGFRIIGISFIPLVTSLVFPVFFQAVGAAVKSSLLTVVRTVVLFVPLGALFAQFGLNYFWLTYPVTDTLTSLVGLLFYRQFLAHPYVKDAPLLDKEKHQPVILPSRPGVILTIARQHGSSGKEIGRRVILRGLHEDLHHIGVTRHGPPTTGTSPACAGARPPTTTWWWTPPAAWRPG